MFAAYKTKKSGNASVFNTMQRPGLSARQDFRMEAFRMYPYRTHLKPAGQDRAVVQRFPERDERMLLDLYDKLNGKIIIDYESLFNDIYDNLTTEVTDDYFSIPPIDFMEGSTGLDCIKQTQEDDQPDYYHVEHNSLEQDNLNSRFIVNTKNQHSTSLICASLLRLMDSDENKKNMKFKAFYGNTDATDTLLKYDKIVVYYNDKIDSLGNMIEEALIVDGAEYGNGISAFYQTTDKRGIGMGAEDEDSEKSFSEIRAEMIAKAYLELMKPSEEISNPEVFLNLAERVFRENGYDPDKPWLPKKKKRPLQKSFSYPDLSLLRNASGGEFFEE